MTTKRQKQVAAVMIILPLIIGAVMQQLLAADSFVVQWEGTVSSPKSVRFEFHDFGAVLIAVSLIGFGWLAYLLIRGFFSSRPSEDQSV